MGATAAACLALCCFVAAAAATPFTNCTSGQPAILSLDVQGCEVTPCQVVQGSEIIADTLFAVERATKTVTPLVRAQAFGIWVEYPVTEKDGCQSLVQAECPLEPGERVTYRLQMSLPPVLPKLSLPVELTLKDDYDEPMACFQVDIKVV